MGDEARVGGGRVGGSQDTTDGLVSPISSTLRTFFRTHESDRRCRCKNKLFVLQCDVFV